MPIDHYENFPVASLLLPRKLRRPVAAIYRFARSADDIADEGGAPDSVRLALLSEFTDELTCIEHGVTPRRADFVELAAMVAEWHLPLPLFRDLLDAFRQDVVQKRYANFAELLDYCRRSANPVGRLLLHLVDRASGENLLRSDCICSALQLVNFWQDIALDWQKNRVYLPQEDLAQFAISEEQIAAHRCSGQWPALLEFEVARTAALLHAGAELVHQLPGRMGWEIRLTVQGGLRILEKIRQVRGDVFRQRPVLRAVDWLLLAKRALSM